MADENDLLFFLNSLDSDRHVPNYQPRTDPFNEYDEKKFLTRYRLSKSTVWKLLAEVKCTILITTVFSIIHC